MFSLETPRLKIIPLLYEDLVVFCDSRQKLEEKWQLVITHDPLPLGFEEIEQSKGFWLKFVRENPEHYAWYSPWQIILKAEKRIIGFLGFDSHPSLKGEVIVGYMIDQPFYNRGFATEAMGQLIRWAFHEEKNFKIIAETPKRNIASQKVLEKLGFSRVREADDVFVWNLEEQSDT